MDSNLTSLAPKDVKVLIDLNLLKDVKAGTRRRMLGWARYLQYAEKNSPAKSTTLIRSNIIRDLRHACLLAHDKVRDLKEEATTWKKRYLRAKEENFILRVRDQENVEEVAVLQERAQRDQITIKELREALERQKMALVSAFEEDCRYISETEQG